MTRWYPVLQYAGVLPPSPARQGVYVCDRQAELPPPPRPALGETAYTVDTGKLWVWKGNGTGWVEIGGGGGGGVPTSRQINTTAPLAGGGDLSANRTLSISDFVASGASHARGAVPDPGASAGTTKFLREDATWQVPPSGGGGAPTLTDFTQDLGSFKDSGTFDITGLSSLTTGKNVIIIQTAQPISSKGNSRDEFEMDRILLTGYVLNATTIRVHWKADGKVSGVYAFGYMVGG